MNPTTISTMGFNVESIGSHPNNMSHDAFTESELLAESKRERREIKPELAIWDCGGAAPVRPLWRRYCNDSRDSYIFMIDSSDRGRLAEAKTVLEDTVRTIREVHATAFNPLAVLVVCNKADVAGAATVADIKSALSLETALMGTAWTIIATSATEGALSEYRRDELKKAVLQEAGVEGSVKQKRREEIDEAFDKVMLWGPGMEECVAWLTSSRIYEPATMPGIQSQV